MPGMGERWKAGPGGNVPSARRPARYPVAGSTRFCQFWARAKKVAEMAPSPAAWASCEMAKSSMAYSRVSDPPTVYGSDVMS